MPPPCNDHPIQWHPRLVIRFSGTLEPLHRARRGQPVVSRALRAGREAGKFQVKGRLSISADTLLKTVVALMSRWVQIPQTPQWNGPRPAETVGGCFVFTAPRDAVASRCSPPCGARVGHDFRQPVLVRTAITAPASRRAPCTDPVGSARLRAWLRDLGITESVRDLPGRFTCGGLNAAGHVIR